MDKRTFGAIAIIVGVAILVDSLLADGIGIGNHPDFGRDQFIGTVLGILMTATGIFLMVKNNKS